MTLTARPSAFLRLPREIRYEIYDHLCRPEPKSYPFNHSPIHSIDQRAPPMELFVSCRYLYQEIRAYFYARVTFRMVSMGTVDPRKNVHKDALAAIKQAKKIEFRLTLLVYPNLARLDIGDWPHIMGGWLAEQVDLLLAEAEKLEIVTVSVSDISKTEIEWEDKKSVLAPLKRMIGKVRFRMGEVTAKDEEEKELWERLGEYVKDLNTATLPNIRS